MKQDGQDALVVDPVHGESVSVEVEIVKESGRRGATIEVPVRVLTMGKIDADGKVPKIYSPARLAVCPLDLKRARGNFNSFDNLLYHLATVSLQVNSDNDKVVSRLGEMLVMMKAAGFSGDKQPVECPSCNGDMKAEDYSASAKLQWFVRQDGNSLPIKESNEPCKECIDRVLDAAKRYRNDLCAANHDLRDIAGVAKFITACRRDPTLTAAPGSFDGSIAFLEKLNKNISGGLPLMGR
jgi:hypothetical protein